MDFKKTSAPLNTITYDRNIVDAQTDNIYEAISIISKRTIQINEDIKKELLDKLEEFASPTESLDEIFENKEQIEVSKFYEKLPKAHAMAIENWLLEKIYYRNTEIKNKDVHPKWKKYSTRYFRWNSCI